MKRRCRRCSVSLRPTPVSQPSPAVRNNHRLTGSNDRRLRRGTRDCGFRPKIVRLIVSERAVARRDSSDFGGALSSSAIRGHQQVRRLPDLVDDRRPASIEPATGTKRRGHRVWHRGSYLAAQRRRNQRKKTQAVSSRRRPPSRTTAERLAMVAQPRRQRRQSAQQDQSTERSCTGSGKRPSSRTPSDSSEANQNRSRGVMNARSAPHAVVLSVHRLGRKAQRRSAKERRLVIRSLAQEATQSFERRDFTKTQMLLQRRAPCCIRRKRSSTAWRVYEAVGQKLSAMRLVSAVQGPHAERPGWATVWPAKKIRGMVFLRC